MVQTMNIFCRFLDILPRSVTRCDGYRDFLAKWYSPV